MIPVKPAPAISPASRPTFSGDRKHVYCFLISGEPGSLLTLLSIDTASPGATPHLTVSARMELNVAPSIPAAYQSVLVLQTPWPMSPHAGPASHLESGLAFVSLESGSMSWFDASTSAILPLARGTLGAAPLLGASSGLLLGAARELVYQPLAENPTTSFGPEAAVLNGAFLPRLTNGGEAGRTRYLLLSPPLPDAPPVVGVYELTPLPSQ